jgi:hypothetical protein
MTVENDPWYLTLAVWAFMVLLHLTIVPLAWLGAQAMDLLEGDPTAEA